ncbi:MAG TPA: phosphodiester glycosidase family protein [Chthoniobacterales bacterium]|jgi:hypothetical protein|nr:phosphodiester glycosidase family protein [Chthoniobacterales bacterium]
MRAVFWREGALLCFFAAGAVAQAEWKIASSKPETSPNEKVAHWTTVVEEKGSGARATLHSAVFETGAATLQVIDQPKAPRCDLAEAMAGSDALAGVNGGYFDPEDAPVGLLVSRGRILSPLRKAKLLSGVLSARGNQIEIVRASHFKMNSKVQAAVQCGPLLVENANAVAGLNALRRARRTFAAVDGKGHVALGVSSAVSLAQLARILSLTDPLGEMKAVRALNLDGGSSSAFWFAGEEKNFSLPGAKTVRDFVAIVPRSDR